MIKIDLRLFANLSGFLPENSDCFPVENNTTVEQLLRKLGIDLEQAKIIFINGEKKSLHDYLRHGDRVGIFPPVGGG